MARQYKRYRQGDVVLREVPSLPRNANLLSGGTLAFGETTGHSHRFADGGSFALWEKHGRRFVGVMKPARLVHEEHTALVIPPGIYEQLSEQEFDYANVHQRPEHGPAAPLVRKVRD